MDDVIANSQSVIARGSKSFAAAARLFDAETRNNAYMLYAWCRYCDDRIDGQELGFGQRSPEPEEQRRRLDALRAETRAAMAGEPTDDPIFIAFQRVYRDCGLPARYPLELLDGFEMDVARRRFESLEDTLSYCYHVAGTVGAMMARIMGVDDAETLDRAVDLGIALQLTNISRDVLEDAQDGRVYLPAEWLRAAGAPADAEHLSAELPKVVPVVQRVLAEADRYYASASYGIRRLPFRCAWAISGARSVYRDIGRIVRRRGVEAWQQRASTSGARKAALLLGSAALALAAVSVGRLQQPPTRAGLWTAPAGPG